MMFTRRSALRNGLLGAAAAAAVGVTGSAEAATRRPKQYTFSARAARASAPPSKPRTRAHASRFLKK